MSSATMRGFREAPTFSKQAAKSRYDLLSHGVTTTR
jgi:hypothetical protein